MFSLVSKKFLGVRNIALYSVAKAGVSEEILNLLSLSLKANVS